jgi:hypothetical protein
MQDKSFLYKHTSKSGTVVLAAYLLNDKFFLTNKEALEYLENGCGFDQSDAIDYLAALNLDAITEPIRPVFLTQSDAVDWMEDKVDDPYTDNQRFAYDNDAEAMKDYRRQQSRGCCGFFDEEVIVAGRLAHIGCNYGH